MKIAYSILLILCLLSGITYAADDVFTQGNSGNAFLRDNSGNEFPLKVTYTTDGNSNLLTLMGQTLAADNMEIPKDSGRAYLRANDTNLYPITVVYTTDGNGNVIPITSGGGSGTVSSVDLALPAIFNVSGGPITTTGTITASLANQSQNLIFAGPASGSAIAPTFRSLVSLDIPNISASKITSGQGTLSTSTSGVSITTGINSLLANAEVNVQTASGSQSGLLSAADWTAFNAKESVLNFSAPLSRTVNTIIIPVATSSVNGYLSSTDWSTFNSKESVISAGTTLQYWRGDKSFQTLNSAAVPELINLYYTDARVQLLAKNKVSGQEFWVSQDVGNDANNGSLLNPYKTIDAAITAANSISAYYKQTIIHIAPVNNGGSLAYNENITLSQQGVSLQCDQSVFNSRGCVISGTLTVNLTGTSGGTNFISSSNEVYIKGLVFTSGVSTTVTFSGTQYQRLIATDCYFQAGAAKAAVISNSGASSQFRVYDSIFENNSSSIETITLTAGNFWLYGTTSTIQNDNSAGTSVLQNGASSMIGNFVQFVGQYSQSSNTSTATFNLSTITSGTNPCIVTASSPNTGYALLAYFGCNSSNTNSITGSGVVANAPGNVRFGSSGDIISTVTQASIGPGLPQGEILVGPGAVTGTNVLISIKDGHIKSGRTTAPTTTVNANAGTGASCTVSNASDTAGTISLTFGTASFATGVQCAINFNKIYGVAPICVLSSSNANAASDASVNKVFVSSSTSSLSINYGVAQSTASQINTWTYHCIETQ